MSLKSKQLRRDALKDLEVTDYKGNLLLKSSLNNT